MNDLRTALLHASQTATPQKNNGNIWEQKYVFGPNSLVFAGHFPDHPVLPAVVQILMAQILVETVLGKPLTLRSASQAKFTAPLGPDTPITLQAEAKGKVWQCSLITEQSVAARFQIEVI